MAKTQTKKECTFLPGGKTREVYDKISEIRQKRISGRTTSKRLLISPQKPEMM
jgi:hypothetical protein